MYYCLSCQKLHKDHSTLMEIFKTGYTLNGERYVPLGLCDKSRNDSPYII
ncbi:DUF3973 domain-containing protein [Ammoniphilus sp. YIM 78166]